MFGLKWSNKKRQKPNKDALNKKRAKRRKKMLEPIAEVKTSKQRVAVKTSFMDRMAAMIGADVGIDLGSSKVAVYVKGRGLVLHEPSYVARYTKSKEIIAVGEEARKMLGRTPDDIEVIKPIHNGVIVDYNMTEYIIRYFIHRSIRRRGIFKPRVIVSVPSGLSSVEKRAVVEATLQAGVRKVVLLEQPLAAALGVELDKAKSAVAMVINIGGGTTDIAVVCSTGIVVSESLRIGSDSFDEAIAYYLKKRKRLLVGTATAEKVKKQIGTVDRKADYQDMPVRGRDNLTGLPKEVVISTKDIQKALEESVNTIIDGVKSILEKTPPEMIANIVDHGIILTGGGALIEGLDRLIMRSTGVTAYLSENPLYAVILGTGRALQEIKNLEDILEELQ